MAKPGGRGGRIRELAKELEALKAEALDESRADAVAGQRRRGKLTARERIALLCDPGSFVELGILGHHQGETAFMQGRKGPGDGVVVGHGLVDGRPVCCASYDFTFLGGSMGTVNDHKMARVRKMAIEYGYPLVFFCEGGGARVQERMGSKATKGHDRFADLAVLSGWAPIVAAVVGPTYAGHANLAGIADYVPMVEGASMGMAGPKLVEMATGEKLDMTALGAEVHCARTGMADRRYAGEPELIESIRRFLAYFPGHAGEAPPIGPRPEPPAVVDRIGDELLDLIPDSPMRAYAMHRVIELVFDRGSLFELKPEFARNLITTLARLDGHPVGVIANNPMVRAGTLDSPSSDKMAHFISLCDAFDLPLVFLVDVPGYMVGLEAELAGIVRRAMKPIYELGQATVPRLTVLVRKAYGLAYHAMGAAEFQPDLLVAWPTAEVSPMGPEGAVNLVYGEELRRAADPKAEFARLVEVFRALGGPLKPAQEMRLDDVIDPRDTRRVLAQALALARGRPRHFRARPPKKHGVAPV
jgi:acetyl-CoA carboxylase carboxyltransferase component